ncbi:hypothetical protein [Streptomyces afghaniensis]|uniref:hypothetical protein n=1 Tax=Streptomyces afghaniensis TaxID=66865 RepID=UPI0027828975|nr:hypothetical protein [Streptomyces afghaniensis]MDQ1017342.1 hypothetical protein [Streptomyces afghaniensis]
MSITQQHLLDSYRAQSLGEPAPPAPGTHDWQVVRERRDERQFRAVLAGRPARRRKRIRHALGRWLSSRRRATG